MFESITSEAIQRWTRIGLYYIFGAIGSSGVIGGVDIKLILASGIGFGLTALWTKYGSTVSSMLTEVEKTAGVEKVEVKVDDKVINPVVLSQATPAAVVVKAS